MTDSSPRRTALGSLTAALCLATAGALPAGAAAEHTTADPTAPAGQVYTIGSDYNGALGNGSPISSQVTPQRLSSDASSVTDISIRPDLGAAVRADGTLLTWGENGFRSFVAGQTPITWTPTPLATPVPFVDVEAGYDVLMGIDAQGGLWVRGRNIYGYLLTGDTRRRADWVRIKTPAPVKAVVPSNSLTLYLTTDGRVFGAGLYSNALGPNASSTSQVTPIEVPLPGQAVSIDTEWGAVVAAMADGTVWAWGSNSSGQLGQGYKGGNSTNPVQVPLPGPAHQVDSTSHGAAAVLDDGSVYTWGSRENGALGRGTATTGVNATPGRVAGLPPIVQISGAQDTTMVRDAEGRVYGWGSAGYIGGDDDIVNRTPVPVPVPGKVVGLTTDWTGGFIVQESAPAVR